MNTILLLVLCITLTQLADAYLRFLAFEAQMTTENARRLKHNMLGCAIICFPVYALLFSYTGIVAATYKFVLMLGWMPYLAVLLRSERGKSGQVCFVFGMSAMWSFLTHNWSNIAVALFMTDASESLILRVHSLLYLLWFGLLWPWERRIFRAMLPAQDIFNLRPLGIYFAVLPLAILFGHLVLMADGRLWHSWEERISRLYLPVAFFITYRMLPVAAQESERQQTLKREEQLLQKQVENLTAYRELMERNEKKFAAMRRDLKQSYRHIKTLLQRGRIDEAKRYLKRQKVKLNAVAIRQYSDSTVINAAVSLYVSRAEALGMTLKPQIKLPSSMYADANDVAVLLSNLLENAIAASAKEKWQGRGLTLILRAEGRQCVLEIANRCRKKLRLDETGFPQSARFGQHGTGMASLKRFTDKYDGYAAFSQSEGWIRLLMYWEDKPTAVNDNKKA